MKLARRFFSLSLATIVALAMSSSARAGIILNFGQNGTSTPVTATASGPGSTAIAGVEAVTIAGIAAAVATPVNAFLSLNLNSVAATAAATTIGPVTLISQEYTGTFSITQNSNGSGTNYLSGTVDLFAAGIAGGASLSMQSILNPVFTSSVIPLVPGPTSANFSLTGIATPPGLSLSGGTIAPFTSSVTGTFSGHAVPEPSSMALLGIGGVGWFVRGLRRRRTTVV